MPNKIIIIDEADGVDETLFNKIKPITSRDICKAVISPVGNIFFEAIKEYGEFRRQMGLVDDMCKNNSIMRQAASEWLSYVLKQEIEMDNIREFCSQENQEGDYAEK